MTSPQNHRDKHFKYHRGYNKNIREDILFFQRGVEENEGISLSNIKAVFILTKNFFNKFQVFLKMGCAGGQRSRPVQLRSQQKDEQKKSEKSKEEQKDNNDDDDKKSGDMQITRISPQKKKPLTDNNLNMIGSAISQPMRESRKVSFREESNMTRRNDEEIMIRSVESEINQGKEKKGKRVNAPPKFIEQEATYHPVYGAFQMPKKVSLNQVSIIRHT